MSDVGVVKTSGNNIGDDVLENLSQASLGHIHVLLRSIEVRGKVDGFIHRDLIVEVGGSEIGVLLYATKVPCTVLLFRISRAGGKLGEANCRHRQKV